jgi:PEP-CTERM motif
VADHHPIQGNFVRKTSVCLVALSAAAAFGLASAAQAGTTFDTSLSDPPGVFFGTGNFNTHYAVTTDDGVEIGLKSKIRGDADDSIPAVGDVYAIALGNRVNFDYAVIPGSVDLSNATALLTVLNVGTGQAFSFNPAAVGDNTDSGSAYENSEQIAFFPVGFNVSTNATYDITLSLSGVIDAGGPISVENVVVFGSGAAVPEPAAWAMMIVGLGGAGVALRRSRKTSAFAAV